MLKINIFPKLFCLFSFIFFNNFSNKIQAQNLENINPIQEILQKNPQEFGFLFTQQASQDFGVEVLFTQLTPPFSANLSEKNSEDIDITPTTEHIFNPFLGVKTHYFAQNPQKYFNPASLVKLPISLLGLEKIQKFSHKNINIFTRLGTKKILEWQQEANAQNLSDTLSPTLARYIEKMMLTSDNEAYIRTFEFLGQDDIHQSLRAKGYKKMRIIRRFSYKNAEGKEINCDTLQNRYTNPIYFCDSTGKIVFEQEMKFSQNKYYPNDIWQIPNITTPSNYFNSNYENYLPLEKAHHLLLNLFLKNPKNTEKNIKNAVPFYVDEQAQFDLNAQNDTFLKRSMGAYPQEGKQWRYDPKIYQKTYKKYLFYGRKGEVLPNVRIFNVVGWWAGSVVDCAYIVDYEHNFSFFLSAVFTLTSANITEKDGYGRFAFPFLENLGKKIYDYEKERRKNLPENVEHLYFDFWKKK